MSYSRCRIRGDGDGDRGGDGVIYSFINIYVTTYSNKCQREQTQYGTRSATWYCAPNQ